MSGNGEKKPILIQGTANHLRVDSIRLLVLGMFVVFSGVAVAFRTAITSGKPLHYDEGDPFEVKYAKRFIEADRKLSSALKSAKWFLFGLGLVILAVSLVTYLISL